jgi:hypothetical protein
MKNTIHLPFLILPLLTFLACTQTKKSSAPEFTGLDVPCQSGGEPNLHITASGQALLSWVEYLNDSTDALVFSKLEDGRWGPPQTIATGSDWFVNWADFPSLVAYRNDNNALAAHWLQMSAPGTYDYDVHVAQSHDGGKTWGPSFVPHSDGVSAEHGFVSMLPTPDGRIFAAWLDGRFTKQPADGSDLSESRTADRGGQTAAEEHEHGGGGAMTLRCATFDKTGQLFEEAELDHKVCDCCQTAAAWTPDGPIVAYRNRSDEENRDIFYTRKTAEGWSTPKAVFADNWHITGCPVNGPALCAEGETVALAWFSIPGGIPQVKVAFSTDAGETFGAPVLIAGGTSQSGKSQADSPQSGKPEGRVDVVLLSAGNALVSWMQQVEDGAEIRAVEVSVEGRKGEPFLVAPANASRQSGFPRMVKNGDDVLFAWTVVDGDSTHLASAVWRPDGD